MVKSVTDSEIAALAQLCLDFDVASKATECLQKEREKASAELARIDSLLCGEMIAVEQARADIMRYVIALVSPEDFREEQERIRRILEAEKGDRDAPGN